MSTYQLQSYLDEVYTRFPESDGRPVIGITGNYDDLSLKLGQSYYQSVVRAGGVPLVIPRSAATWESVSLFAERRGKAAGRSLPSFTDNC